MVAFSGEEVARTIDDVAEDAFDWILTGKVTRTSSVMRIIVDILFN
jgi:hypothetical protein